jgi:hypothetical protein
VDAVAFNSIDASQPPTKAAKEVVVGLAGSTSPAVATLREAPGGVKGLSLLTFGDAASVVGTTAETSTLLHEAIDGLQGRDAAGVVEATAGTARTRVCTGTGATDGTMSRGIMGPAIGAAVGDPSLVLAGLNPNPGVLQIGGDAHIGGDGDLEDPRYPVHIGGDGDLADPGQVFDMAIGM